MMTITPNENPQEQVTFSNNSVRYEMCLVVDNQKAKSTSTILEITDVPESFLRGMADCQNGRVVDMEQAMTDTPPNAD
jgi:hypothetical protein